MSIKLLFDPVDGTILGAQVVGGSGVDKRIDVLATAMTAGIPAPALADLELAYAPPFSSAKDPVNMLGYMAENLLSGDCDPVEPADLADGRGLGLDAHRRADTKSECDTGMIPGAVRAPLDDLRADLPELGPGPFVVCCQVGQRGHTATSLLQDLGVSARNMDGGYLSWKAQQAADAGDPAAAAGRCRRSTSPTTT